MATSLSTTGRPEPTEINFGNWLYAVVFSTNGEYLLIGGRGGVQVWRVEDAQQTATMKTNGIVLCLAVSKDEQWVAGGTNLGNVFLWDTETCEQVFEHKEDSFNITSVDFSPDSTRFISASQNKSATIWDAATREEVRTFQHDAAVAAAKYSPQGDRIATGTRDSIRLYDSNDGRLLLDIKMPVTSIYNTGLLWFNNSLLAISNNKIAQMEVSTGLTASEWPVSDAYSYSCIALPKHGEFIAYSTERTMSILDTSAHTELGLTRHTQNVYSIAISPDDRLIVVGEEYGKITITSRSHISAATASVSASKQGQDEQTLTSDSSSPESPLPEGPNRSDVGKSESNNEDRGGDLLDADLPSSTPGPLFDYDEAPSPASSIHAPEGEAPLPSLSRGVQPPSDVQPVTSFPAPEVLPAGELPRNAKVSQRPSKLKNWLRTRMKKNNKGPILDKSDRPSREPRHSDPAAAKFRSQSLPRMNKGPSTFAAGKHQRRTVRRNTDEEPSAQQVHANVGSEPPVGAVRVTQYPGTGKASISLFLPDWMLCCRGTTAGTD